MTKFEKARLKYKPAKITCLFIAEAPPKIDSDRFFYFEIVHKQDSLFLETMKCLYPSETNIDTKLIRANKKHFLIKFMDDGFYLIDSLDIPFEIKYNSKQKEAFIKQGQRNLLGKIKRVCSNNTKIILISATVFRANYLFLKSQGLNILNNQLIDFPGSGGQKKFREKLALLLNSRA